jgi:hypothetical protein
MVERRPALTQRLRSLAMRVRQFLLAAVAALLTAGLLAGPAAAKTKAPKTCNGYRALCNRTFDKVVLAGAHNAMSSKSLKWLIPNQSVDMPHQLGLGIRALLIDTHYGVVRSDGLVITDDDGKANTPGPVKTYFCHELCQLGAQPLVDGLRGIAKWLKKNPNNVLLFDNEDYIKPTDFAKAMKSSGLLHYVYRGKPGPKWPTLKTMITKHQQIVVLAEHNDAGVSWDHKAYDGILQETGYDWETQAQITSPANWAASCAPNRGGTKGSLFLMNHWWPDSPPSVPDPVTSAQDNATSVLVGRAKACKKLRGKLPTVLAVDQVTYGGVVKAAKKLNGV